MPIRILFAAILGGGFMFVGGFLGRGVLHLVERHMSYFVDEVGTQEALKKHFPNPGTYMFPYLPKGHEKFTPEQLETARVQMNAEFKRGPTAFVVVMPPGEDMMDDRVLGMEAGSNVLAALIASIVIACTRPGIGYFGRWILVILMGVMTWLAVNASFHIWYRFPLNWTLDELYASLIEWSLAGLPIAMIVKPKGEAL